MKPFILRVVATAFIVAALAPVAARAQVKAKKAPANAEAVKTEAFKPQQVETTGSATVGGHVINYDAYAGTLIVHPKKPDDAEDDAGESAEAKAGPPPEASMFYVAYFKTGEKSGTRPLMFLYNGGPGSSTLWLHMGAFGPRRVVTADDTHTPPAPYRVVNNDDSLLDAMFRPSDSPGSTGMLWLSGNDARPRSGASTIPAARPVVSRFAVTVVLPARPRPRAAILPGRYGTFQATCWLRGTGLVPTLLPFTSSSTRSRFVWHQTSISWPSLPAQFQWGNRCSTGRPLHHAW